MSIIRCQCNALTETDFARVIDANREAITGMCLTKATAFIFQQAKEARPDDAPQTLHKCPRPCYSAIQSLINEMESRPAQHGYDTPRECFAATLIAGYMLEIK